MARKKMATDEKMVTISVTITPKVINELEELAASYGLSRTAIARLAITDFIKRSREGTISLTTDRVKE